MEGIGLIAQFLDSFGPIGFVVLIGYAYVKKDKQLQDLNGRFRILIEQQTVATLKMETAINSLRELIGLLSRS